ncbi:MAG: hypothetical protein F6K47_17360 [Symploca sp. SIO2E6]|nr:hypothetical protein [Symploca sp. SIO2E6]
MRMENWELGIGNGELGMENFFLVSLVFLISLVLPILPSPHLPISPIAP